MEIAESLLFWTKTFRAYYCTRMAGRFYLAALFLVSGSIAVGQRLDVPGLLSQFGLAYLMVFQFRLWDDLAARATDRLDHPNRVLSKIPRVGPFYGLLVSLFAFNCALLYGRQDDYVRLAMFVVGSGALLLWYRNRRKATEAGIADFHIVLIKYPLIVFLLSDPGRVTPASLLFAMSVVYLTFCIYEVVHDKKYWTVSGARTIAGWEMAALLGAAIVIAFEFATRSIVLAMSQGLFVLIIAGYLTWIFPPRESLEPTAPWVYLVFVIGFIELVIFSIGGPA